MIATLCLFLPLSGFSVVQQFHTTTMERQSYFVESIADAVPVALLPNQIGDWMQTESRVVNRSPDDPLGTNSVIWTFEGSGITANISVDGYYSDFHDLSGCYAGLGWELESSRNRTIGDDIPLTELSLYKDSGEFGLSLFTCLDSTHTHLQPPAPAGTAFRLLLNRLRSGQLISKQSAPVNPPVYQIQVMTTRGSQLLAHEHQLLEELFRNIHDIVRHHLSAKGLSQ